MDEFDKPQSRKEAILQNILGAENELLPPQSRNESILQSILYDTPYNDAPESSLEELLLAIKNGGSWDGMPQSRNEAILLAKLNGEDYTEPPQSRVEELLIRWLHQTPQDPFSWTLGYGFYVDSGGAVEHAAVNTKRAILVSGSGDHYIPKTPDGSLDKEEPSDFYPIPLAENARRITATVSSGHDIYYHIYALSWNASRGRWQRLGATGWTNSSELVLPSGATHWIAAIKIGSSGATDVTEADTGAIKFDVTVFEPPEPGDNLYDPAQNTNNYYITSSGNPSVDNTCSYTGAIPVELGKTYTFEGVSSKANTNNKRLLAYSSTAVSSGAMVGTPVTVAVDGIGVAYSVSITITDASAKYIRASFNSADTDIYIREVVE